MLMSKGFFRLFVIDDFESVIIDLDAIGIGPHFIKLILPFIDNDLPIYVMLEHSDLYLVPDDIVHGKTCM